MGFQVKTFKDESFFSDLKQFFRLAPPHAQIYYSSELPLPSTTSPAATLVLLAPVGWKKKGSSPPAAVRFVMLNSYRKMRPKKGNNAGLHHTGGLTSTVVVGTVEFEGIDVEKID